MSLADTWMKLWPQPLPTSQQLQQTQLIAHRGAWGTLTKPDGGTETLIENTLTAILKAEELGADGVEFDIHFTKDNIPVIHHDPSLKRITGKDILIAQTEIIKLIDSHVAPLTDLLKTWQKKSNLFIELKTIPTPAQTEMLFKILGPFANTNKLFLMSFDAHLLPKSLQQLGRIVPIYGFKLDALEVPPLDSIGAGAILTGHYVLFNQAIINKCRSHNLGVGTGFADNYQIFCREVGRNIDYIFTNRIRDCLEWKTQMHTTTLCI